MGSAGCLFVWAMELFVFDRKVGKWEMREFGNPGIRNSELGIRIPLRGILSRD